MISNGNVLIYCNDAILRKNIRHFLKERAYETLLCHEFNDVQIALRIADYRLLITDMPYPDEAYQFLTRKYPALPIVCIASNSTASEGTIHMLPQPFDISEITHLLQSHRHEEQKRITLGKYEILPSDSVIRNKKNSLKIPKKELELLLLLIRNSPELVNKDLIRQRLWPSDSLSHDNSINVYFNNLKKYFQEDNRIVLTHVHGKGIRLNYTE